MMTNYFNSLREKGIEVNSEDTIWIDCFCSYVLTKQLFTTEKLERLLNRTITISKKGQTTADIVDLFRKVNIDFEEIDNNYSISLTEWKELLNDYETMAIIQPA